MEFYSNLLLVFQVRLWSNKIVFQSSYKVCFQSRRIGIYTQSQSQSNRHCVKLKTLCLHSNQDEWPGHSFDNKSRDLFSPVAIPMSVWVKTMLYLCINFVEIQFLRLFNFSSPVLSWGESFRAAGIEFQTFCFHLEHIGHVVLQ